jgi:hypothetical protein
MGNPRNFLAAALPVFLLLILVGVMRLISSTNTLPEEAPAPRLEGRTGTPKMPSPPPSRPADAATQKLVAAQVAGQVAAFHKRDYGKALTYSAEGFRKIMTAERFGQMIDNDYPGLTNSTHQTIGQARLTKDVAVLEIATDGAEGQQFSYQYTLIKEKGKWCITGCIPLPNEEMTTPEATAL